MLWRSYSNCPDEHGCCNPHINIEKAEDEEGIEMKNAEEKDLEDERMKM